MLRNQIIFENIYKFMPSWKWSELKVALEKSIIFNRDIISYAIFILSEDIEQFDKVLKLSIAEEDEVEEILCELVVNEEKQDIKLIYSKWIFVIIYDAYMYLKDKVYDVIDDVYSEFDYPEDISNLIAYMPSNDCRTIEEKLVEYIDKGRNDFLSRKKTI